MLGSTETEGSVAIGGNLTYGPGVQRRTAHPPRHVHRARRRPPDRPARGRRIDHATSSPQGVLQVLSEGYVKVGDPTGSSILDQDSNNAEVNTHIVPPAGAGYDSTPPRIQETVHQPTASVTDTTGCPTSTHSSRPSATARTPSTPAPPTSSCATPKATRCPTRRASPPPERPRTSGSPKAKRTCSG